VTATEDGLTQHTKEGTQMKPNLFDDLTKALATAPSRRQALKAIGAAVGGALGLSRFGIAFADNCRRLGQPCETGHSGKECCSGLMCQNGRCVASTTTSTTTSIGTAMGFSSPFELTGFHEV
jgi:hypothetical protein